MPILAQDDFTSGLAEIWAEVREAEAIGGRARLPCTDEYSALSTERLYPLRDTTYTVELVTRPDAGEGTTQAILEATIDPDNKFILYLENDVLNFEEIAEGAGTEATILYEPTAHRWWRIRIEGTTVFWETSPDGSTWTTRRTKEAALSVNRIAEGRLLSGFYGEESGLSPAYAEFDNFSIDGPLFVPAAVTGATAGAPLTRSAMLTGTVDPNLSPTSYYFEFGETTEYGRSAPAEEDGEAGDGADPVGVRQFISGLRPNTTYHYRLVASSEGGTDHGDDRTFKTSPGITIAGRVIDPIIRSNVFAGRELGDFNQIQEAPGAVTEVPDPAGSEDTVFKLTVSNDDVYPETPTENPRAQALSFDEIRPGDVIWLQGGFYLPADFPDATPSVGEESGWISLLAFYGPPFDGTGPWEISVSGDPVAKILWQRNDSYGFDIPWEMPLVKEQWVDVRMHFRFAEDGWVEMWINGERITFFEPGSSYNPSKHAPTDRLEMQTRDHSNNGGDNQAKILNYRLLDMFESVTVYHHPLLLDRVGPAAVKFGKSRAQRISLRELPPMRQYILATTPGGKVHRWGEDEPAADKVIGDLQDSDTVPGGYKELSCSLPRKPHVDYGDMQRGTRVQLFGAGQMKVGEYRLQQAPRTSGDKLIMDPAAVGYQGHLSDDESAQCIPIDADLNAWGVASAARRISQTHKFDNAQIQVLPAGDPGGSSAPVLQHMWTEINNDESAHADVAESWYDSQGVELGKVILDFVNVTGPGVGDPNWNDEIQTSEDGVVLKEKLKDFDATSANQQSFEIPAARFFLMLRDYYSPSVAATGKWEIFWRNIRLFDRSGIPIYGIWPNVGVLASDVIAYALSRWAPLLNFTTGSRGSIRPSNFPIPHLPFKESPNVMQMVEQALRFEQLEWAVWSGQFGPTFYLNPRGEREGRKRWRVRCREAQLKETGQSLDRAANGVIVQWQDVDGSTQFIGPPGSGFRLTDERLLDTDPLNPANQIPGLRKWPKIAMKSKGTSAGAIESGQRYLEQLKLLDTSGEATLTGYVEDEHGARWPYYCVHAGDLLDPIDSGNPGYRYIVSANRSRSSRSTTVALDAPPDTREAMLERLDVEELVAGLV